MAEFRTLGWSGGGPYAPACAALMADRCRAATLVASLAPYAARGPRLLGRHGPGNLEGLNAAVGGFNELDAFLRPLLDGAQQATAASLREELDSMLSSADQAALTDTLADELANESSTRSRGGHRRMARRCTRGRQTLGICSLRDHCPSRGLARPSGPVCSVRARRVACRRDPRCRISPARRRRPYLAGHTDRRDPRQPGHPRRLAADVNLTGSRSTRSPFDEHEILGRVRELHRGVKPSGSRAHHDRAIGV